MEKEFFCSIISSIILCKITNSIINIIYYEILFCDSLSLYITTNQHLHLLRVRTNLLHYLFFTQTNATQDYWYYDDGWYLIFVLLRINILLPQKFWLKMTQTFGLTLYICPPYYERQSTYSEYSHIITESFKSCYVITQLMPMFCLFCTLICFRFQQIFFSRGIIKISRLSSII